MIVITRKDGGVSIMALAEHASEAAAAGHLDIAVETEIAGWPESLREQVVSWREMPDDAVPPDRTFRNAWCDVTPELVIDIDMDRARDIHKNKLREMRAPKLAALDVEYQRADEAGDTEKKKDIARRKQALRDVTADPGIASAASPDELKAVIPDALV